MWPQRTKKPNEDEVTDADLEDVTLATLSGAEVRTAAELSQKTDKILEVYERWEFQRATWKDDSSDTCFSSDDYDVTDLSYWSDDENSSGLSDTDDESGDDEI